MPCLRVDSMESFIPSVKMSHFSTNSGRLFSISLILGSLTWAYSILQRVLSLVYLLLWIRLKIPSIRLETNREKFLRILCGLQLSFIGICNEFFSKIYDGYRAINLWCCTWNKNKLHVVFAIRTCRNVKSKDLYEEIKINLNNIEQTLTKDFQLWHRRLCWWYPYKYLCVLCVIGMHIANIDFTRSDKTFCWRIMFKEVCELLAGGFRETIKRRNYERNFRLGICLQYIVMTVKVVLSLIV